MARGSIVRSLSWLSIGYVGRSLAYLALTTLLARALGPSSYGELSLFIALAMGIAYLAGAWPFLAVPILAARGPSIGDVFRAALVLALAGAAVTSAILLPVAWVLVADEVGATLLLAAYALALIGLQGVYSVFQTRGRMRAIATAQTAERASAAAVVAVLAGFSAVTVVRAEVALAASAALVMAAALVATGRSLARTHARVPAREVARAVGPMAAVTTGSYVVAWVDLLVLAAFRTDHDVGVYALAYQVFMAVVQLASLWIVAALPEEARRAAGDGDAIPRSATHVTAAARLWAAGVALVAIAAAVSLTFVFGADFGESVGPLMILLAGASVLAPYYGVVAVFLAKRRARALAWVTAVAVALNVILDLVLVPVIGVWGPAIATTVQTIVATFLLVGLAHGARRAFELAAVVAAPASMIALLAAYHESPVALAVVGGVALASAYPGARIFLDRRPLLRSGMEG